MNQSNLNNNTKIGKINKLEIYEEEVSKSKRLKGTNLDLNKKFKIMQELVMNK